MQTNLLEYLERTAPRLPEKVAYSDGTEDMTFSELYRASRSIGSALCRRGYVKEPIAILMAKHPRQIASFYGVIYAGCFYVSLDADMPAERMKLILESVGARVILTDGTCKKALQNLQFAGEILEYQAICTEKEDAYLLDAVRARQIDTDPIYVVFTSGSTGVPKAPGRCRPRTECRCFARRTRPRDRDTFARTRGDPYRSYRSGQTLVGPYPSRFDRPRHTLTGKSLRRLGGVPLGYGAT